MIEFNLANGKAKYRWSLFRGLELLDGERDAEFEREFKRHLFMNPNLNRIEAVWETLRNMQEVIISRVDFENLPPVVF